MGRLVASVLFCLAVLGCRAPVQVTSSDVSIARFDGRTLYACTISFGWTRGDVTSKCGEPIDQVKTLSGAPCMVYRNDGHALRSGEKGARFVAVCFEKPATVYVDGFGGTYQTRVPRPAVEAEWVVSNLYGLDAAPAKE